jgi:aminoglycoside 6-adenylyltransferase
MCARAVVREELWAAQLRDRDLKAQLERMIEWDHWDTHDLDPDVRAALPACWARFDAADIARALDATIALFARLAGRTARRLALPPFDHARVRAEIDRILGSPH